MTVPAKRAVAKAESGRVSDKSLLKHLSADDGIDSISLEGLGVHMIFEEINEDSSRDFCEFLVKSNYILTKSDEVTIMINSPGGSVYDGFGMIDLMECSRVKIKTVGIGLIASMASIIFTAGTKGLRTMTKNSFLMTHQFSEYFEGKYHQFVSARSHQDDLHKRFVDHFLRHSTMTEKEINDILLNSNDTYISAEEAKRWGLCDVIKTPWS
jgi:ATP-dependent Clp protease protease subunit